jgi:hypothetical protein
LLPEFLDDFGAGGFGEPLELFQAILEGNLSVVRGQLDAYQQGFFLAATRMGVRLLQDSKE